MVTPAPAPVRRGSGPPPRKPKHNWVNRLSRESRKRTKMLDKSRENYFRYDMEEILGRSTVPPEQQGALIASIFARGARQTTQDAKDFAKEKLNEGVYDEPTFKAIVNLIEGYSTWR